MKSSPGDLNWTLVTFTQRRWFDFAASPCLPHRQELHNTATKTCTRAHSIELRWSLILFCTLLKYPFWIPETENPHIRIDNFRDVFVTQRQNKWTHILDSYSVLWIHSDDSISCMLSSGRLFLIKRPSPKKNAQIGVMITSRSPQFPVKSLKF